MIPAEPKVFARIPHESSDRGTDRRLVESTVAVESRSTSRIGERGAGDVFSFGRLETFGNAFGE